MPRILVALLILGLGLGSLRSWAANDNDPIDGVFKGIYGNSISVQVPSLVSKSPTNEIQNGDLSFQVNASTNYRNFTQLTDLRYGDPVRVEYSEDPAAKDKQKVATQITKLESTVVSSPAPVITAQSAPAGTQTVTTTTTTKINPP